MVSDGNVTWPNQTEKCYLDIRNGYWDVYLDEDGNCGESFTSILSNPSDIQMVARDEMAAKDYYVERSDAIDDDNYGWSEVLEYDEYPLELQCSSCFLQVLSTALLA